MAIEKRICVNCGCVIGQDDLMHEVDGECYCDDCFEELFTTCERCGKIVERDTMYSVRVSYDDRYHAFEQWCEYCWDNHTNVCEDCGQALDEDLSFGIMQNGDIVCDRCSDNYYYCDSCGYLYDVDDWDSDEDLCVNCSERQGSNLIKSYHGGKKDKKIGECSKRWRGAWRGLGVELEIDRYERDNASERKLVSELHNLFGERCVYERDGSLNYGFEVISLPHTQQEFYKVDWARALQLCKDYGYLSHTIGTCGLHIHLSRELFGVDKKQQNKSIANLIYFYENNKDDILKISRRVGGQKRWGKFYNVNTLEECKKVVEQFNCSGWHEDRYYAINLTNRHTVEIRINRGTLNLNTFLATIDFVLKTAKRAKTISKSNLNDLNIWLKDLNEGTKEYLKTRQAFEGVI